MGKLTPQELELLKESTQVVQMAQSEGWGKVLSPHLEVQLNQSFPDPSEFDSDEKYLYAAKSASIYKKIIAELLQWVEGHDQRMAALKKKQDSDEADPFSVGKE